MATIKEKILRVRPGRHEGETGQAESHPAHRGIGRGELSHRRVRHQQGTFGERG